MSFKYVVAGQIAAYGIKGHMLNASSMWFQTEVKSEVRSDHFEVGAILYSGWIQYMQCCCCVACNGCNTASDGQHSANDGRNMAAQCKWRTQHGSTVQVTDATRQHSASDGRNTAAPCK